mmetsp:Transcript_94720/g.230112  ORF Transcript_94720/g.230112 Transcript_94720/m.230112 type:complete len:609 (+) Transcript_94720:79-1905(+)
MNVKPTSPTGSSAFRRSIRSNSVGSAEDVGRRVSEAVAGRASRGSVKSSTSSSNSFGVPPAEAELKAEPEVPQKCYDRGSVSCFFGGAVLANAVFIGMDTQVRASGANSKVMVVVEAGFMLIFLVELLLRIYADRCPKFLRSTWNLLDAFLVGISIFDVVSTFMFEAPGESGGPQDLDKLRIVRLLKITRMVRMVRIIRVFRFRTLLRSMRGLIVLVQAIIDALKALGWVIAIFAVTTYLGAIVTTEFVGLTNVDDDPLLDEWFGDMFKSMFTLMQLSTLDDWVTITRYVGNKLGGLWMLFFLAYVLVTNLVILNVALATLIQKVISLHTEMKSAKTGEANEDDVESWMLTPSSMDSGDEEERAKEEDREAVAPAGGPAAVVQGAAERLAQQLLGELFDKASELVGREGIGQSRVVSERSLRDALVRVDVQEKLFQVCPTLKAIDSEQLPKRVVGACPKPFNKAGLVRQEFVEACLALKGELSMNHFVSISMSLQQLEKHVDHELVHLNKHQRKMNRRFLKLRHRLRKVYHFDGAPRKMVDMVTQMQIKQGVAGSKKGSRLLSQGHLSARSSTRDRRQSKESNRKSSKSSSGSSRNSLSQSSGSSEGW